MSTATAPSMAPLKIYINGKWVDSEATAFEEATNSSTGKVIARTPFCTVADVDRAVAAAKAAFPAWRDTPVTKRTQVMFEFRNLLLKHQEELAELLSTEHGKVYADASGEVRRGIDMVEYACGMPTLMMGDTVENVAGQIDCRSLRQPLGVCAGITPFNFPIMVPMWMFPIAITAGNTFVCKPSEKTPRSMARVCDLLAQAGLPPGVFNMITGNKVCVDRILQHPDVKAISFVGSTPIAKYIYTEGSKHGKRVQALGGAKNHAVVLPDCDLEKTVDALMSAGYGSAGERCMAVSVVVAVGDIAEPLVKRLREEAAKLRVGLSSDKQSEMGPLITQAHRDKVASYIDKGIEEGASLEADGRTLKVAGGEGGHFLGASLFDKVEPDMTIYKDEIFGPVLSVVRRKTLDEAIELVNSSEYGNGTAIFTNSGGAARRYINEVTVGMVGVNVSVPVPMAFFSFSGWKASFFGSHHAHGKDGVAFYTENKVITERWFNSDPAEQVRKWSL